MKNYLTPFLISVIVHLVFITGCSTPEAPAIQQYEFSAAPSAALPLAGYDWIIPGFSFLKNDSAGNCRPYILGSDTVYTCYDMEKNRLTLSGKKGLLIFPMDSLLSDLQKHKAPDNSTMDKMRIKSAGDQLSGLVLFKTINAEVTRDSLHLSAFKADILIGYKDEKTNEVGERNQ